jgi:PAS domain S-box-containing protein
LNRHQFSPAPLLPPLHPGLEALADGFFTVDSAWLVTYWNAAAERMFSIPREKILGRELWQSLPCFAQPALTQALQRVERSGSPHRSLERLAQCNIPFLSLQITQLEGSGVAVQLRDATDEVKQSEQYANLLESIQDGFVAVDPEWRIAYMNRVAERFSGVPRERAKGSLLWTLLPLEAGEARECIEATMRDGIKRHLRSVEPKGTLRGDRLFDLWTYPLAGGGISILFEDATDRVTREQQLALLALEAREANQAKSRFFAAVSHELRTPLNAIVGYTHLLATETYGPLPEGALRAADRAGVCAEHLTRLVDDVLLLTATELGKVSVTPSSVRLSSFLRTAVEPHRHQAEAKGLTFAFEVPEELPEIETDPERLRQLLNALLNNAVKFTRKGSITLSGRMKGDQLEISVSDTGSGIPAEERERIFSPFERLEDLARSNPLANGAGLGLTVARQLAGLLHGTLRLDETVQNGCRFALTIPARFENG